MTPREAIETIRIAIAEVEWDYPLNYAIAFETAISALEKIESLQTRYDLAVAEREANMKAYLEQANELAAARATIKELEAECERQYEQAEADIRGNMADGGTSCHWCIDGHKAEARKEFAESLHKAIDGFREKREMPMLPYTAAALEFVDRKIDELVKEVSKNE